MIKFQLLPYLLTASVCMSGLFLLYKVFLHKHTFFTGNRAFLLCSLLISIIVPVLDIPLMVSPESQWVQVSSWTQALQEDLSFHNWVDQISGIGQIQQQDSSIDYTEVILFVYFLGIFVSSIRFLRSLFLLLRLRSTSQKQAFLAHGVRRTNLEMVAFSFLGSIFLGKKFHKLNLQQQQQVIAHEWEHIRLLHSVDICLLEILGIVFWFNPLMFHIKKTLREIHEFTVDANLTRKKGKHQYARLLIQLSGSLFPTPLANHFTQSQLKNRIHMLLKAKTSHTFYFLPPVIISCILLVFICCTLNIQGQHLQIAASETDLHTIEKFSQPKQGAMPIIGAVISARFGHINVAGKHKNHRGIDFKAVTGIPVYASFEGIITTANATQTNGYGHHIRISHEGNLETMYAHLSDVLVKNGQQVKRGEMIGRVGSTGKSSGPHLHFEIKKAGKWVDPAEYLPLK